MAGETPTTAEQQQQRPPPTEQGFAQNIEKNLGLLGFVNYLLHPDQPDFEHYNGTYPSGMRDKLSSIVEMAGMFGYEIDFEANISEALDEMTGEDFFNILYDANADNPDTPENEGIQLTLPSFERLMAHAGVKDAFLNITKSIVGNDPKLGAMLESTNIQVDLSSLQHDGKPLTDMPLSQIDSSVIEGAVSRLNNGAITALLSSLPEDGDISQKMVINNINDKLEENGYDRILSDDMDVSDAIEKAITHLDETGFTGFFKGRDWAEGIVMDGIRTNLQERMSETIATSKTAIQDGSYLAGLTSADLYKMFEAQLQTPEGREKIQTAMSDPENLALIKSNLASADLMTLMQGLPNGQALIDEKMSVHMWNSIRGFLDQNGLFQTVSSIWGGLIQFVGQLLERLGLDSVTDKLSEQLDIGKLLKPESPLARQFQPAADPSAQVTMDDLQPSYPTPQAYLKEQVDDLFSLSKVEFDEVKAAEARGVEIVGGTLPDNFISMSPAEYVAYKAEGWRENANYDASTIPADVLKAAQDILEENNVPDPTGDIASGIAFGAVQMHHKYNSSGPAVIVAPGQGD